jgi:hypothetical protein
VRSSTRRPHLDWPSPTGDQSAVDAPGSDKGAKRSVDLGLGLVAVEQVPDLCAGDRAVVLTGRTPDLLGEALPEKPLARGKPTGDPLGDEGGVDLGDNSLDRVPGAALSPRAGGADEDDELVGRVPARPDPVVRVAPEHRAGADEELDQDRCRVGLGRGCEHGDDLADEAGEGRVGGRGGPGVVLRRRSCRQGCSLRWWRARRRGVDDGGWLRLEQGEPWVHA